MIIPNQRHLFDIPDSIAYLNTAYMSPLMHNVVAEMQEGVQTKVHPWSYMPPDFFSIAGETRSLAAKVYGTNAHNIALVSSVSYGVQIAANNLPLEPEQDILLLGGQFPSNIYPWKDMAARKGAEVRILTKEAGQTWTQAVLAAMSEKTGLVAVPHMHWANGEVLDLGAIRRAANENGAALTLDLTQSLGALPFNVDEIAPDFAVAAGYKWLMGPYTSAFLYVAPKWQTGRPLEFNWMNRKDSENFSGLTHYVDEYQPGALRFDMGEKSNPALLKGASAALSQILEWGIDNIAQTLREKTDHLANALQDIGLSPMGRDQRAPHYLGVSFPKAPPDDILARLAAEDIYVSIRGDFMRVTPHLFVTDKDMSRFITRLAYHLGQ